MGLLTQSIDGYLLVNKPSGPTSYDIIRIMKRRFRGFKIGHCGTLDPLASGLLILLFGKATKKQSFFMGQDKVYRAFVRLGVKTDSGDITGKIIEQKPVPAWEAGAVSSVLDSFIGNIDQIPPMYSALKVSGTPLYKLARKGQTVERKARSVRIYSLKLINLLGPDQMEIEIHCSSGTYVRSLAEDIGERLGTVATLAGLVRERIGDFVLADSVRGEDLQTWEEERLTDQIKPVSINS